MHLSNRHATMKMPEMSDDCKYVPASSSSTLTSTDSSQQRSRTTTEPTRSRSNNTSTTLRSQELLDLPIPAPIQETLEAAGLALMEKIGEGNLARSILQNMRELLKVQVMQRIQDAHDAILATRSIRAKDAEGAVRQMRHGRARIAEIVGYMEYYGQESEILERTVSVFLELATSDKSGWDNELKIAFVQCNGIRALVNAMPVFTEGRPYFLIFKSLEIAGDADWNAKVEDLILRAGGFGEIVQPMNLDDIETMAIGVDLLKCLIEWGRPNRITAERLDVHGKLQRHLPTLEGFVRRGRDYERRSVAAQRVQAIHQGLADLDAMYD